MLLSLTGICLVAGAILAGVNQFTAGPIAVAKATALEEAIKAVAPEFDNKPTEDVYMAVSSDGVHLYYNTGYNLKTELIVNNKSYPIMLEKTQFGYDPSCVLTQNVLPVHESVP